MNRILVFKLDEGKLGGNTMKLLNVHGSGNDFFILDQKQFKQPLTDNQLQTLAQRICDRKTGLHGGADGVLSVTPSTKESAALGRMRVINADGSEASMCGNGIRTVARYLSLKNQQTAFKVQTMYADLLVKQEADFAPKVKVFAAEISPVSFAAKDLKMHFAGKEQLINQELPELAPGFKFSAVAVPNPHLIAFVDHQQLIGSKLGEIASYLNDGKNPYFPDGVNVSFVEILAKNKIFVRTYERGVGYTNACGTAMSASSLMYVLLYQPQELEQELEVCNPGGMVKTIVHQRQDSSYWISLIGNATFVAEVTIPQDAALQGDFQAATWQETGEQAAYENFVRGLKKDEIR